MQYAQYLFSIIFVFILMFPSNSTAAGQVLKMSTTTSTQASGLLDVLLPVFLKDTGIAVKVIAKGTGAAIRDGQDGNVDMIFVHARGREEDFVRQGFGTQRYQVMHNDFIILGPVQDPAGIAGMHDGSAAFKKIAQAGSLFISRGDDSGTHTKEQELWQRSGVPLLNQKQSISKNGQSQEVSTLFPDNATSWYLSIGQGMGKVLTFADEKQAYTLSDRGTYLKYRFGRKVPLELTILCEGDPFMANPYGVIPVNPERYPHVRYDLARQFVQWVTSPKGQTIIANYRLFGKQLFYPELL